MSVSFKVIIHTSVWKDRDGGWDVNDSRTVGTITVNEVNAKSIIKALRNDLNLIYESRKMRPLGQAIRSSPYIGGHIDLVHLNGRPAGFLERLEEK